VPVHEDDHAQAYIGNSALLGGLVTADDGVAFAHFFIPKWNIPTIQQCGVFRPNATKFYSKMASG